MCAGNDDAMNAVAKMVYVYNEEEYMRDVCRAREEAVAYEEYMKREKERFEAENIKYEAEIVKMKEELQESAEKLQESEERLQDKDAEIAKLKAELEKYKQNENQNCIYYYLNIFLTAGIVVRVKNGRKE